MTPKNIIEELFVRDITYLTWDILRLRRLRTEFVRERRKNLLFDLAEEYLGAPKAWQLDKAWKRDKNPRELMSALLECGVDDDVINAEVLVRNISDIERFDRLLASAEGRRNAVYREIDRHRDAVQMRRLREAVTSVEDAEFEDVTTGEPDAAQ